MSLKFIFLWLLVGIPLVWGVAQTLYAVRPLFS